LRLRPDLPEVQLAAAFHRYRCYRDYEKARVLLTSVKRALPNNPEALALAAYMDRRQSNWEESTKAFEKASNLDPRNPEVVQELAINYMYLRRYRECLQTCNRLIELKPDDPSFKALKSYAAFLGNADLVSYRAALETLPSSLKEEPYIASWRFMGAVWGRDWSTAKEILSKVPNEESFFPNAGVIVPRGCLDIWLALLQGDHSTMEARYAVARDQLNRKVEANPENAKLISALGLIDAALGHKQQAIQESKRAVEMLPVSKDAFDGPGLVANLAIVYAWTNEKDLAFHELAILINMPGGSAYGELKCDPAWDPLRKDPRFEQAVARLAPHE